jgi:hypothetical protein
MKVNLQKSTTTPQTYIYKIQPGTQVSPNVPYSQMPNMDSINASINEVKSTMGHIKVYLEETALSKPVKLLTLTEDEYVKLGINKTNEGVFVKYGDVSIGYGRKGTLIRDYSSGKHIEKLTLAFPIPVMVTDKTGKHPRSYRLDPEKIESIKNALLQNSTGAAHDSIMNLSPSKILLTSLNTLVPVLIMNDKDTTKGNWPSDLIFWYDPLDPMLKTKLDDNLKQKMLVDYSKDNISMEIKPFSKEGVYSNAVTWSDFKVFPNPAVNVFNLTFNMLEDKRIKINMYDITGKLVKNLQSEMLVKKGDCKFSFDISSLTQGIYILAVQTPEGENWTQRVVIK